MAPKTGHVLAPRGYKKIIQLKFGNVDGVTVFGLILPPMVAQQPDNWIFDRSESGWMPRETFFEYVSIPS